MATTHEGAAVTPRRRRRRFSVNAVFDNAFFVLGGLAAVWLAWIVLTESFSWGWFLIGFFVLFWLVLAYLALPRLHRILTRIYVPNYFIGRARTSDGLLGDPVNIALLGGEEQVHAAMAAAGWIRAHDVTFASSVRIVTSTLSRRSYDEAPVSPLFLFERKQDFAYQQEVLGNPAKRHHVRFWRCPDGWLLPGGYRADWLAAGTYDRAVGFSLFTLQITHKIEENTDVERDHIVATVMGADAGATVRVIEDFSTGYHSRNGGGDTIETDGDLPVLDFTAVVAPASSLSSPHPVVPGRALISRSGDTQAGAGSGGPDTAGAVVVDAGIPPIEAPVAAPARRPLSTSLGALLMALRIVAGLVFLLFSAFGWNAFIEAELGRQLRTSELDAAQFGLVVYLAVSGLLFLFYLLLAWLAFRGSNWARITAMTLSSIAILAAAIDYLNGGPQVTLRGNVLGLPLDILVLLALSSQGARAWARRLR